MLSDTVEMPRFACDESKRKGNRDEFDVDDDAFEVGHLGRIVTQKNHARLIRIFTELPHRQLDAALVLAGDRPLLGTTRDLARQTDIDVSIRLLRQGAETNAPYSAFGCPCLPSLYEGLPVVGIEAQMAGLSLVTSDAVNREVAITRHVSFVPRSASDLG